MRGRPAGTSRPNGSYGQNNVGQVHPLGQIHTLPRPATQVHGQQILHLHIEREEGEDVVLEWDDLAEFVPLARDLEVIRNHIITGWVIHTPEKAGIDQATDYGGEEQRNKE